MSTVGDILSTVGDILSTVGEYHDKYGGYLEYRGGVQYRGDIMMHVGKYHEYRGGICGDIMSSVGCSVPWGTQITKDSPHGTHDITHSTR